MGGRPKPTHKVFVYQGMWCFIEDLQDGEWSFGWRTGQVADYRVKGTAKTQALAKEACKDMIDKGLDKLAADLLRGARHQ